MMVLIICFILIGLTSIFLCYYLYELVLLDANNRGIQHPKFWSLLAATGQSGEGLMIYLFKRRKTSSRLNPAMQQKMLVLKNKIYCLLAVDMVAFLGFIAVLFKFS